jgi:hypothetical protein
MVEVVEWSVGLDLCGWRRCFALRSHGDCGLLVPVQRQPITALPRCLTWPPLIGLSASTSPGCLNGSYGYRLRLSSDARVSAISRPTSLPVGTTSGEIKRRGERKSGWAFLGGRAGGGGSGGDE